jgi:oxygen-dependent protoporphyrinogen oxidase
MKPRVVVVGGGVAGLAITFELLERIRDLKAPPEVLCLEADDRPGGNIRSDAAEDFLVEWGPNGFLDNVPATLELVRRLGLQPRLLPAEPVSSDRFIFRKGRLRKLPTGPVSFVFSDVLSVLGRLRVLCEPLGPGPRGEGEESVFDFAARRIGREAASILVSSMVTGIYAGDARALSLQATFPKMWRMERDHGTLTRAMLHKRKKARARGARAGGPAGPGGHLTSFEGGLEALIHGLARAVGSALRLRTPVTGLAAAGGGGYRLETAAGESIDAAAVVLACPAWSASRATSDFDPDLSRTLSEIPSASLCVVHLGFEDSAPRVPPVGFGYLIPRGEGPRILGTIWASSIFGNRAPAGKCLLTTMVGGAHDPEAVELEDDALLRVVREDLRMIQGIEVPPSFVRIFRHPRGIPQYTLGHMRRLESLAKRLEAYPGLFVAGNSYRGISVNSCVEEAPGIAEAALADISRSRGAAQA